MSIVLKDSGQKMPIVGFGLWKVPANTCTDTVYNAIKACYRLFDGAQDYGNERKRAKASAVPLRMIWLSARSSSSPRSSGTRSTQSMLSQSSIAVLTMDQGSRPRYDDEI
ncbi:hypothetical protein V1525DRAFT_430688 [Lipomyces kononenkoae]|uniref:Uncharacterized protein n=1 Tax=Lipomyces kononenkoae TaxID=34357 RepID=A0ACC3TA79_LIPKO